MTDSDTATETGGARAVVEVVPLGRIDEVALAVVAANVDVVLGLPAVTASPRPEPTEALIPTRRQYDASMVLTPLAGDVPPGRIRLGLTARDLCLPVLTYVFGQAQMNGRAAVVSLCRLGGPGGAAPRALFYTRLAKVALHETAHLLGVSHCHRPGCLMCFSSTLGHVDALDIGFCPNCARVLGQGRRRLLAGA
ncbi:MAG: hypothetical protein KKC37_14835 [Proteobacteria bacterium]|nr:hypothetical protein [Pseudomonadota bacterium]